MDEFTKFVVEDGRHKALFFKMMAGEISEEEFQKRESALVEELTRDFVDHRCAVCQWKNMQGGFPWASTN